MTFGKMYSTDELNLCRLVLHGIQVLKENMTSFSFWCPSRLLAEVISTVLWALSWDAYMKLIILLSQ